MKKKILTSLVLLVACAVVAVWSEQIFNMTLRGYLAMNGVHSRFIREGGTKVFFFEGGDEHAETVLLLHGVGGNSLTSWFRLLPQLAKRYHVIAPDLFFANLPDLVNSGYHINSERQLVELVMRRIGIKKTSIVGLSFGAWPALQMAVAHPEQVDKLVLIAPLGGGALAVIEQLHLDPADSGRDFYYRIFENPPPVPGLFLQGQWDRTTRVFDALPSFRVQLESVGRKLNGLLPQVKCPTLVLYGEKDRIIPVERFEFIASQVERGKLIGLEASGHAVVWDQSALLLDSMLLFLAKEDL